jgi:hypothetical protein
MVPGEFAICRLAPDAPIPDWIGAAPFLSITRTVDELTVVCLANQVPNEVTTDKGWFCLKLEGPFPFSMTGVLVSFLDPLKNSVPIFAISTFDTDYVLIGEEFAGVTFQLLRNAGHELI